MKLIEILKEMDCWDGYKPGNPKTKISSKTGKRVNNCVPIKEEQSEKSPAYMYSPVGFGCHVCKFYYVENKKSGLPKKGQFSVLYLALGPRAIS